MLMDRKRAASLGHETLQILRAGRYAAPSGRIVHIRPALDASAERTVEYPPETPIAAARTTTAHARISVENATVLEVGRRLADAGPVAALNFAAAGHPGGGWLTGARAQEESIARASGLCGAIDGRQMYAYHRQRPDPIYSDWTIYSPDVPVFRTDDGTLLEEPWAMSILTCAAVNGYALRTAAPHRMRDVPQVMAKRTARVLSIAAVHGTRRLILGAWGCGAFGLDPKMMAGIFKDALHGEFVNAFDVVVFAVMDFSPERRFIGPFERHFGSETRL
jgi:uncharacterized protein (TIGR02452 family)